MVSLIFTPCAQTLHDSEYRQHKIEIAKAGILYLFSPTGAFSDYSRRDDWPWHGQYSDWNPPVLALRGVYEAISELAEYFKPLGEYRYGLAKLLDLETEQVDSIKTYLKKGVDEEIVSEDVLRFAQKKL